MRTDIRLGDVVCYITRVNGELHLIRFKVKKITIDESGEFLSYNGTCIPMEKCFKSLKEAVGAVKQRAYTEYNATIDRLDELERTGETYAEYL